MSLGGRVASLTLSVAAVICVLWPAASWSRVPPAQPREVNITADSAPGWTPTVDDEMAATGAARAYLTAKDGGRMKAAYGMMAVGNQALQSLDQFTAREEEFNKRVGLVVERRFIKVTWTKDPAQAPGPGVYAAIDLVSRFSLAQRSCGFLVMFRPPEGGSFKVAREETNFFTDADAAKIEQQESKSSVDATWAQLAANCPNYPGDKSVAPPPIAESAHNEIGYPTVAAALEALRARKDVQISTQAGWTVVSDPKTVTIWSFAPEGHPAFPAVARRHIYNSGTGTMIDMRILCESSKAACDDFVRSFEQLNAQMSAALKSGSAQR